MKRGNSKGSQRMESPDQQNLNKAKRKPRNQALLSSIYSEVRFVARAVSWLSIELPGE
jgi:hypothetical protein